MGQDWFWDDFDDGNADGWAADFRGSAVHEITFPSYAGRNGVFRYEGQALNLTRDSFSFPGNQYTIEFEARLVSSGSGSGSDHIAWEQYYDNDTYR